MKGECLLKYDDIKKGKFYKGFNKDNVGHPSLVVSKNKKNRFILIVKFTKDKTFKDVEKEPLKVRIDENYPDKKLLDNKGNPIKTYIVKHPFLVKSGDLRYREKYEYFKVNKVDKYRVDVVKRRKPK